MKKSNAKRVLTAALAGMMALSLAACGEQGGGNPAESQKSAAETTAPAQSQTARQTALRPYPRRTGLPCRRNLPLELR